MDMWVIFDQKIIVHTFSADYMIFLMYPFLSSQPHHHHHHHPHRPSLAKSERAEKWS